MKLCKYDFFKNDFLFQYHKFCETGHHSETCIFLCYLKLEKNIGTSLMAQMVKITLNLLSCNKFGICCFCCSVVQSCPTICDPMDCSTPGLPVPHHLLKCAQVHAHCFSDAIQPSHPLTPLLLLPSIFPSIRDFSNKSAVHIRWPEYWNFSISPFQWVFSVNFP